MFQDFVQKRQIHAVNDKGMRTWILRAIMIFQVCLHGSENYTNKFEDTRCSWNRAVAFFLSIHYPGNSRISMHHTLVGHQNM